MSTKDAYARKAEARLDEWNAEIDKLKAKAAQADADAEIAVRERMDELESKRDEVRRRLAEFKDAGDDAWDDLKTGFEAAARSLQTAVESAASRFS